MKNIAKAKFIEYALKNDLIFMGAVWNKHIDCTTEALTENVDREFLQKKIDDPKNFRRLQNRTLTSLQFKKEGEHSYLDISGKKCECFEFLKDGAHFLICHTIFEDKINDRTSKNTVIYHIGTTNLLNS